MFESVLFVVTVVLLLVPAIVLGMAIAAAVVGLVVGARLAFIAWQARRAAAYEMPAWEMLPAE